MLSPPSCLWESVLPFKGEMSNLKFRPLTSSWRTFFFFFVLGGRFVGEWTILAFWWSKQILEKWKSKPGDTERCGFFFIFFPFLYSDSICEKPPHYDNAIENEHWIILWFWYNGTMQAVCLMFMFSSADISHELLINFNDGSFPLQRRVFHRCCLTLSHSNKVCRSSAAPD